MLQLAALVVVAIAAFFVTRAIAANSRDMTLRDAEAWYDRGEQLIAAGRLDDAVESLRRASVRNRYERRYALALARALARKGDTDAARSALLTLREGSPEDADVNLELARLAARRQDVTEAVRFYHNVLYAPWAADAAAARREVRFELIDLLLQHNQAARAQSELLAAATDLPDDVATRIHVAQLFAHAGDARHALDQYERALRLAPHDDAVLSGAGATAFALGDFARARRYLRQVSGDSDQIARMREVADLVLAYDPLTRGIGVAERRRRLIASVDYLLQRLTACASGATSTPTLAEAPSLHQDLRRLRGQAESPKPVDQDAIEAGLDVIDRAERLLATGCGSMTAWDQALNAIAHQHAVHQ